MISMQIVNNNLAKKGLFLMGLFLLISLFLSLPTKVLGKRPETRQHCQQPGGQPLRICLRSKMLQLLQDVVNS